MFAFSQLVAHALHTSTDCSIVGDAVKARPSPAEQASRNSSKAEGLSKVFERACKGLSKAYQRPLKAVKGFEGHSQGLIGTRPSKVCVKSFQKPFKGASKAFQYVSECLYQPFKGLSKAFGRP